MFCGLAQHRGHRNILRYRTRCSSVKISSTSNIAATSRRRILAFKEATSLIITSITDLVSEVRRISIFKSIFFILTSAFFPIISRVKFKRISASLDCCWSVKSLNLKSKNLSVESCSRDRRLFCRTWSNLCWREGSIFLALVLLWRVVLRCTCRLFLIVGRWFFLPYFWFLVGESSIW